MKFRGRRRINWKILLNFHPCHYSWRISLPVVLLSFYGIVSLCSFIMAAAASGPGLNLADLSSEISHFNPGVSSSPSSASRHLLSAPENLDDVNDNNTKHDSKSRCRHGEMPWQICCMELNNGPVGWVIMYFFGVLVLFIALAIICDDFFVPSLEAISEKLQLSEDVAGATFMAAGSSAPELFTSVAGVTVQTDVGIGTIVGSAVFNILVIIALTAMLAGQILCLDWRPLVRDSFFYGLSIVVFIIFAWDGLLYLHETILLLILYAIYIIMMKFNPRLMDFLSSLRCCNAKGNTVGSSHENLPTQKVMTVSTKDGRESEDSQSIHNTNGPILGNSQVIRSGANLDGSESRRQSIFHHHKRGSVAQLFEKGIPPLRLSLHRINPGLLPPVTNSQASLKSDTAAAGGAQDGVGGGGRSNVTKSPENGDNHVTNNKTVPNSQQQVPTSRPNSSKSRALSSSNMQPIPEGDEKATKLAAAAADGGGGDVDVNEPNNVAASNGTIPTTVHPSPFATADENGNIKKEEVDGEDEDEPQLQVCFCSCCPPLRSSTPQHSGSGGCSYFTYLLRWVIFIFSFPFLCMFTWTIPDCSKPHNRKWYWLSFGMSVLWIAALSFAIVMLVEKCGCIMDIHTYTMGLVVIAIGTSIPDLLSSILVARDGYGDMAVSNALGSNVFDILLGLGLPYFIRILIDSLKPVQLLGDKEKGYVADGTLVIVPHVKFGFILLGLLVIILTIFILTKFKLNRWIGVSFLSLYALFLAYAFIQELVCDKLC